MTDLEAAQCQLTRLNAMIGRRRFLAQRYSERLRPLAERDVIALPTERDCDWRCGPRISGRRPRVLSFSLVADLSDA